jgi:hypothetical protein
MLQNFNFYGWNPSTQTNFYDWFVDMNNTEKKMDALAFDIVTLAPSGASMGTQVNYGLPAGDSLTVDIR